MAERKAFPLRIDAAVHAAIEKWAADDMRSTNAQIEFLLRDSLRRAGRLKSRDSASEKTLGPTDEEAP